MDHESASRELQETIERIETSWRALLDAIEGVPDDRLTEPGVAGDWSIKDLMGHIAFWEEQAFAAAQRHLAGEPDAEVDVQALNEREAAARRDLSAAEQRAAMEQGHATILDLLVSTPEIDPRVAGLCGCLEGDTYQHYDEHAADIRAWRAAQGA